VLISNNVFGSEEGGSKGIILGWISKDGTFFPEKPVIKSKEINFVNKGQNPEIC